jgi:hypothetical protein
MTDEMNRTPGAEPGPEAAPEAAAAPPSGEETRSAQAREWLAQLQQMIDRIAAEAGPVARDVAAKAAELAAVAGEKAGPFAKRGHRRRRVPRGRAVASLRRRHPPPCPRGRHPASRRCGGRHARGGEPGPGRGTAGLTTGLARPGLSRILAA